MNLRVKTGKFRYGFPLLENICPPENHLVSQDFRANPQPCDECFSVSQEFIPVAIYCHTLALGTLLYKETEM